MRLDQADHVRKIANYLAGLAAEQAIAAALDVPGTRIGPLLLDHGRRELRNTLCYVRLGRMEYIILARLSRRIGMFSATSDLIAALYDADPDAEPQSAEEVLRANIMSLRNKLKLVGDVARIVNERSVGYALEVVR